MSCPVTSQDHLFVYRVNKHELKEIRVDIENTEDSVCRAIVNTLNKTVQPNEPEIEYDTAEFLSIVNPISLDIHIVYLPPATFHNPICFLLQRFAMEKYQQYKEQHKETMTTTFPDSDQEKPDINTQSESELSSEVKPTQNILDVDDSTLNWTPSLITHTNRQLELENCFFRLLNDDEQESLHITSQDGSEVPEHMEVPLSNWQQVKAAIDDHEQIYQKINDQNILLSYSRKGEFKPILWNIHYQIQQAKDQFTTVAI
jgi:hypothetical protein